MEVAVTIGSVSVLSVKGDIDSNTFRELIDRANQVLEQGYKNLVLDLSGADYISSAGLIALQTIVGRAGTLGGKVVCAGATKRVSEVLGLTGFDKMLTIYPDVAAAKASF